MADNDTSTDNTSEDQQQTTDDANASDQTTEDQSNNEALAGAPESYTDFTLPDGVELNTEVMGEFSKLAKDANLPQDKAQGLVELGVKMAKGFETSSQKALSDFKEGFAADLAKDTKLGGENLDANLAIAQRGIEAYGSPELQKMLEESGLNRHPELVRYFHAVGQTVKEDSQADGSGSGGGEKSLADRMYGPKAA